VSLTYVSGQVEEPLQVYRIFREPPTAVHAHGDRKGDLGFEIILVDQHVERIHKRVAGHQVIYGHNPRGERTQPCVGEPAGNVFSKYGKPFLQLFVTRHTRTEQPEGLCLTVIIGYYMCAYFMLDQSFRPPSLYFEFVVYFKYSARNGDTHGIFSE